MKSKTQLNDIIDALYKSNNDNEIAIYVLLSMIIAHMNNFEFTEDDTQKQWMIIEGMFRDYEIKDMTHLQERVEECVAFRDEIDLKNMTALGGVH